MLSPDKVRTPASAPAILLATVAFLLVLAAPGTADAAKKISGKLSKGGYTVIALAKDGEAKTDRAPQGKFRLRPPAKKVTLHLRAPDGTYAGPIVVGTRKHGKRAIEGVYSGAKLGNVEVKPSKGFAKVKLRKKWIDKKREARAKKGVPIGAGNFGFVKSKKTKGGAPGDLDLDGVADQLDVDRNGNKHLDASERSTGARSTGARASEVGGVFPTGSKIDARTALNGFPPANANGGSTDERIAAAQAHWGKLGVAWIGIDPGSGELDCGGLTYCSRGGTGRLFDPNIDDPDPSAHPPFPDCCDLDKDGFGSLDDGGSSCESGCAISIFHGATVDQIGTGDVLVLHSTVNGVETQSATTVGFAFSTQPVYSRYDDGQGNSANISYATDPCPAEPCTVPVRADANGDVVVELSVWRPQRSRLDTEVGDGKWMDMGNLTYLAQSRLPFKQGEQPGNHGCPQGSLSESDPNLAPPTPEAPLLPEGDYYSGWGGFRDSSADQPQDPSNTLTFTVNLTQCIAARGLSFEPGDVAGLGIQAFALGAYAANGDPGDVSTAESGVYFELKP